MEFYTKESKFSIDKENSILKTNSKDAVDFFKKQNIDIENDGIKITSFKMVDVMDEELNQGKALKIHLDNFDFTTGLLDKTIVYDKDIQIDKIVESNSINENLDSNKKNQPDIEER